jgi:hypothetical protein
VSPQVQDCWPQKYDYLPLHDRHGHPSSMALRLSTMHESDRPAVFVVRRQETYRSWDACRFRVRFVIHMWIIHSIFLYSLVKKTYYFSTTTRSFSPRLSYWIKEMDYWVWDWLDRKVPWLLCRAWTLEHICLLLDFHSWNGETWVWMQEHRTGKVIKIVSLEWMDCVFLYANPLVTFFPN